MEGGMMMFVKENILFWENLICFFIILEDLKYGI